MDEVNCVGVGGGNEVPLSFTFLPENLLMAAMLIGCSRKCCYRWISNCPRFRRSCIRQKNAALQAPSEFAPPIRVVHLA